MKKVIDTKQPTVKQMISMSENLREKFKKYSSMQLSIHVHPKETNVEYWVYIENGASCSIKSWKELLSFYHQLMKEETDES